MELKRISEYVWELPREDEMRVPGRVFASEAIVESIRGDKSLKQISNVACLPGVVRYAMAMPDVHQGYGFPIGGVAATDPEQDGIVSPGGVGYDINCGVRVIRTDLPAADVKPKLDALAKRIFQRVPVGIGSDKRTPKLSEAEMEKVLIRGAAWSVEHGSGSDDDLVRCEEGGCLKGADPALLSPRARRRGSTQVGSLGSGNHFLEIDEVTEIYDADAAAAFGLEKGAMAFQVHTGSRGLGHQVCDDFLKSMVSATKRYGIQLRDRELVCVPVHSPEGKRYLKSMACAANFAWANRQRIMYLVLRAIKEALGTDARALGARLVYDVCHNIAKLEEHEVDGRRRTLCVHRKGATRAFPPGHPEVPAPYRQVGQPVLIPGDMGRCSFVLVGRERAMAETFGSSCHGAGRMMSRGQAIRQYQNQPIAQRLRDRGIVVKAKGRTILAEEISEAYKNVEDVVDVMHELGITRKVAKLEPLCVVKG